MTRQCAVVLIRLLVVCLAVAGVVSGSLVLFGDASAPSWWPPTLFLMLAALFLLWIHTARDQPRK